MSAHEQPRYGVCPKGHGDEQGIIAAEVSADRRPYPNCPICGIALKYADACLDGHSWCVGPEGPEVDAAWGGKCSTCYLQGDKSPDGDCIEVADKRTEGGQ